jgi:putative phosphonate metabolism protein
MPFVRYALYFTPPAGAFANRGAAWLGWDSATGQPASPPALPNLPAPLHEITDTPRRYGLHATLAPPFRLAEGRTGAALQDAITRFCQAHAPVTLDGLEIAAMGRFLALVPTGSTPALDALAADAVRAVDTFRAPLDAAALARRRTAALTPDQDANLVRWGYPYVMSAFRFHITLTGKRPRSELPAIRQVIARHLMPAVPRPVRIDAVSLMGEDAQGRFHLIRRQRLGV